MHDQRETRAATVIFTDDHAHEILPRLFVGDMYSCEMAARAGMSRMCVLEQPCGHDDCFHQRILDTDGKTNPEWLERASAFIVKEWMVGAARLLVHCAAGVERSPLTVAWFMGKEFGTPIDDAYAWLKSHRSFVEDRRAWLR